MSYEKNMETLGHLRMARASIIETRDDLKQGSRELSVALTELETAILWVNQDIMMKKPPLNQQEPSQ